MKRPFVWKITAGMAFLAGLIFGQAPARLTFEVASIRPSPPIETIAQQIEQGKLHVGMSVAETRIDIGFLSVGDMIPIAYRVKTHQVAGPDSMRADHWDILAKIPEGSSKDQVPEMLQALLEERFKLQVHKETREQNVYALVVGKDGPRMKPAGSSANLPESASRQVLSTPQGQVQMSADGKTAAVSGSAGPMRVTMPTAQSETMKLDIPSIGMGALADLLRPLLDKPAVDMTGLKGSYQVSLELGGFDIKALMREAMGLGSLEQGPQRDLIFEAVQKLGLKLEARKVPVEMIVVDHVEKTPTAN